MHIGREVTIISDASIVSEMRYLYHDTGYIEVLARLTTTSPTLLSHRLAVPSLMIPPTMLLHDLTSVSMLQVALLGPLAIVTVFATRFIYNVYVHPLSNFRGPWYASATSLPSALISLRKREPDWLLGLTKTYGS